MRNKYYSRFFLQVVVFGNDEVSFRQIFSAPTTEASLAFKGAVLSSLEANRILQWLEKDVFVFVSLHSSKPANLSVELMSRLSISLFSRLLDLHVHDSLVSFAFFHSLKKLSVFQSQNEHI